MSQQKLSKASGVPRSQLQILEAGGNVTLDTAEKLIAPLGLMLVVMSRAELEAAVNATQTANRYLSALLGETQVRSAAAPEDDIDPGLRSELQQLEAAIEAAHGDESLHASRSPVRSEQ